jgi:hypothetical protein
MNRHTNFSEKEKCSNRGCSKQATITCYKCFVTKYCGAWCEDADTEDHEECCVLNRKKIFSKIEGVVSKRRWEDNPIPKKEVVPLIEKVSSLTAKSSSRKEKEKVSIPTSRKEKVDTLLKEKETDSVYTSTTGKVDTLLKESVEKEDTPPPAYIAKEDNTVSEEKEAKSAELAPPPPYIPKEDSNISPSNTIPKESTNITKEKSTSTKRKKKKSPKVKDILPVPVEIIYCSNDDCSNPGISSCGKCNSVKYCSKECQITDWKMHKKNCASFTLNEAEIKSSLKITPEILARAKKTIKYEDRFTQVLIYSSENSKGRIVDKYRNKQEWNDVSAENIAKISREKCTDDTRMIVLFDVKKDQIMGYSLQVTRPSFSDNLKLIENINSSYLQENSNLISVKLTAYFNRHSDGEYCKGLSKGILHHDVQIKQVESNDPEISSEQKIVAELASVLKNKIKEGERYVKALFFEEKTNTFSFFVKDASKSNWDKLGLNTYAKRMQKLSSDYRMLLVKENRSGDITVYCIATNDEVFNI